MFAVNYLSCNHPSSSEKLTLIEKNILAQILVVAVYWGLVFIRINNQFNVVPIKKLFR